MESLAEITARRRRMERECARSAGQPALLGWAALLLLVTLGLAAALG